MSYLGGFYDAVPGKKGELVRRVRPCLRVHVRVFGLRSLALA